MTQRYNLKSSHNVEPENLKFTSNPTPIKRIWLNTLGIIATMKTELANINLDYIESTPMSRTNIIHRSQKKKRLIARRRNQFSHR